MSSRASPSRKHWDEHVRRHTIALPPAPVPTQAAAGMASNLLGTLGRLVGAAVGAVAQTIARQQEEIARLYLELVQARDDARLLALALVAGQPPPREVLERAQAYQAAPLKQEGSVCAPAQVAGTADPEPTA